MVNLLEMQGESTGMRRTDIAATEV